MQKAVLVVMGSDSDFPVMEPCLKTLDSFQIPYQVRICSAHRSPAAAARLAQNAAGDGFSVIIAAAGLAAHLPGVIAAWTSLPVIGVPIKTGALAGQDALLAIVQMPAGIPVATVAIDGAANAAILAVQILAIASPGLQTRLAEHKAALAASVAERQDRLDKKIAERV
ncbi:MAG: 5-(carboxyamino)imidazole ribonucleotide mutase [Ruminococcaceae bacterium]|nr:5-(carboxyamino)imidazole ribonucleotide mutase [Oscillospiraceae bacterium]